jgi:hypothetical protein
VFGANGRLPTMQINNAIVTVINVSTVGLFCLVHTPDVNYYCSTNTPSVKCSVSSILLTLIIIVLQIHPPLSSLRLRISNLSIRQLHVHYFVSLARPSLFLNEPER